ncbi:T9SS type A sorting domain-containing protein [candidate division KSB1 bacterium]|nr:T9SS type A sorting domain-containing protein [candidate division KSB1 bacterium]
MKRYCLFVAVMIIFIPLVVKSQKLEHSSSDFKPMKPNGQPRSTLININNISMWIRNDGWSGRNPETGEAGIVFPRGTVPVVFQDGIFWVGQVRDGDIPRLRAGGQKYNIGTTVGRIITKGVSEDRDSPDVRIWRIREDWQNADLSRDATELNDVSLGEVTNEQIEAVRQQYGKDWNEWPWQKGAPFYDTNGNGIMDTGEEPGIAQADQVVWFVANDLAEGATFGLFGSPPIGLEMQVTLWAYKERVIRGSQVLANTVFKRYRLIYKGTATTPDTAQIQDMYIAQWSDPDLGTSSDDFAGCDSVLNLGYVYNSNNEDERFQNIELMPPAIGYVFLQGPIEPAEPNEVAIFNFKRLRAFRNLSMSSFAYNPVFSFSFSTYQPTIEVSNLLRGFLAQSDPNNPERYRTADANEPTRFPLAGDPLSRKGDIDGIAQPPGERRIVMSSGPFTMALGDTQEVIIALVGGLGADRLFSVQVMKHHAKWARQLAQANFELPPEPQPETKEPPLPNHFRLSQNFPNPFNPRTEIRYELPEDRHVNLTVYNVVGQKIKTLVDEVKAAGAHSVTWDGTDERGQPVPSGVYLYRFDAGVVSGTKKMILVR